MPIYLSASSISDFIKCPQKVLYRIKKLVPEVKSKEMIIGNSMHYILEKGWKSREVAYSLLDYEVKHNELKRADRTKMEFMVDMFFLNFQERLGANDLIEYRFKLPMYDDVFLVGKMDRISAGNLYDWKTGVTASQMSNDVQCIIYDYAFGKLFGREANSICVASLSSGKLIPYVRNPLYTSEIFERIIPKMIKAMKSDTYERLGMFNHSCFKCPYKIGCLGTGGMDVNEISPEGELRAEAE